MPTKQELIDLAENRFLEARTLFDGGHYDGALYLAGYAVELALKARVRSRAWCFYMDKDEIVTRVRDALSDYSHGREDFALVLLLPNDASIPLNDAKWTLIISAAWLDDENMRDVLKPLLISINKHFADVGPERISRVNVIKSDDAFVRMINSFYTVHKGIIDLINLQAGSVLIDKALLLESQKPNRQRRSQ